MDRGELLALTQRMHHEVEDSAVDLRNLFLQLQKTTHARLAVEMIEMSFRRAGPEKVAAQLAAQLIDDGALDRSPP